MQLTRHVDNRLEPKWCMIGYENIKRENYVEIAPMRLVEGKMTYTPGSFRPLRDKDLGAIQMIGQEDTLSGLRGFPPPSLLYYHNEPGDLVVAFYLRPRIRFMQFLEGEGMYPCPPLVIALRETELFVYACKRRPRPNDMLYVPPFPNFYAAGRMCFGSVKQQDVRGRTFDEALVAAETMLFGSQFSHPTALWPRLRGADRFPMKELKTEIGTLETTFS